MFQKIAKHRANDASHDVHRPPLHHGDLIQEDRMVSLECISRGGKPAAEVFTLISSSMMHHQYRKYRKYRKYHKYRK